MDIIRVELLTIGDELLYGQTLDTNAHWMSNALDMAGFKVVHKTTVGDVEQDILQEFEAAQDRADIVLITGGLGPTSDDLTKPCLAEFFHCGMSINEQALEDVKTILTRRGRDLNELNRLQALVPDACEVIRNPKGTAPGMWFESEKAVFVSMPGVPHEMKYLMENTIIPRLKEKFHPPAIVHRMVKTSGIGESWLAEKIKPWEDALPEHIKLAYLPTMGMVKLRLTAFGSDESTLQKEIQREIESLHEYADQYIYGYDEDTLEEVIGKELKSRGLYLSTAESCTGGNVAHEITKIAGSSDYFKGSIVAYSNEVKTNILNVLEEILKEHGAVSEQTVTIMAEQVRHVLHTDIGIATTGVAGPSGGTKDKPVGTVWIACSTKNGTKAKKLQLLNDRVLNIRLTTLGVFTMLLRELKKVSEEKIILSSHK